MNLDGRAWQSGHGGDRQLDNMLSIAAPSSMTPIYILLFYQQVALMVLPFFYRATGRTEPVLHHLRRFSFLRWYVPGVGRDKYILWYVFVFSTPKFHNKFCGHYLFSITFKQQFLMSLPLVLVLLFSSDHSFSNMAGWHSSILKFYGSAWHHIRSGQVLVCISSFLLSWCVL